MLLGSSGCRKEKKELKKKLGGNNEFLSQSNHKFPNRTSFSFERKNDLPCSTLSSFFVSFILLKKAIKKNLMDPIRNKGDDFYDNREKLHR